MKKLLILSVICLFGCKKNEIASANNSKNSHNLTVSGSFETIIKINNIDQIMSNGTFVVNKGDKISIANNNINNMEFNTIFVMLDDKMIFQQNCQCNINFYTEIQ